MKIPDKFNIGLVQHACVDDFKENYNRAIAGVRAAAKGGAQIICLQEMFRSPYFCTVQTAERFSFAENLTGETLSIFQPLAKELDVALVLPIFEKRAQGLYHNSAIVLDAGGEVLGFYRKMHIPDDPLFYEKYYFTPGESSIGIGQHRANEEAGFKVFKTKYAVIGVLICWDQWYPEAARITALKGAEVLFYPTAIGWHPSEKASFGETQVSAWRTIQVAHSIANGVYVASVNRVGHEVTPGTDGLEFFGNSFISDPFGKIISEAGRSKDEVLVAECSRTHLENTRRNWPFLRDRRIDAYHEITARYLGDEK